MSAADSARPEPGPDAGIDEIEADIERTRAELGAAASAVAAKLDVPARARQKIEPVRRNAAPIVAVAGVVVVGLFVWRRRRR
ncbi:MAG: DUF3618 domain-containing protein [Mycobacterium sp.]|nr:DUF3618 domain-containing protein [Mycobacterium sp.]